MLEFENKDNKVVKPTLNPDAEEYAQTNNVGSIRKAKDAVLNCIVGIRMEYVIYLQLILKRQTFFNGERVS